MEKDNFGKDDFLTGLIQQIPLESPSDDFVERVMASIQPATQPVLVQKPFPSYVKGAVPYALLTILLLLVFSTSDLPFLNWLPGKSYYMNNLVPYLGTLFNGLKNAFASRYVSFGLMTAASMALLFVIDRFFSRRTSV